jgi:serine phosphatase RsbU (regulator of sigma subunit)
MELQLGISKIKKYAVSESGDTLEFIERPGGGLSVVLVDGQRSGKSAKRISTKVAGKVVSLLAEGIRDGAAARAASDFLFHERQGKVTATLNILSVDLISNSVVISRNNPAPVLVHLPGELHMLDRPAEALGTKMNIRPAIDEFPLSVGLTILIFTDGITNAGVRRGQKIDIAAIFEKLLGQGLSAQRISDAILQAAVELDEGRPVDDISVAVLQVCEFDGTDIRRVSVRLPLGPV